METEVIIEIGVFFQDDVSIVDQWFVNGTHYARTRYESHS